MTGATGGNDAHEVVLVGGVANAGAVTRRGTHILRPASPHTPTVRRFLSALAGTGFDGASVPDGTEPDGRERFHYVAGDVPLVPYPDWAQSDDALASLARLLRGYHDAARQVPVDDGDRWSDEMADPLGGSVVCHNDVCLENVVFRHGRAVALLDFDFAAPGRPLYDLAALARMCVPIDDESRVRFGWHPADLPARLRLVADEYGLDPAERVAIVSMLDDAMARGGEFLRRRIADGDANFAAMWEAGGGQARFDRRRMWWAAARPTFVAALREP
jgi:hypothetical protein